MLLPSGTAPPDCILIQGVVERIGELVAKLLAGERE